MSAFAESASYPTQYDVSAPAKGQARELTWEDGKTADFRLLGINQ
jgi:hypothetical protein